MAEAEGKGGLKEAVNILRKCCALQNHTQNEQESSSTRRRLDGGLMMNLSLTWQWMSFGKRVHLIKIYGLVFFFFLSPGHDVDDGTRRFQTIYNERPGMGFSIQEWKPNRSVAL